MCFKMERVSNVMFKLAEVALANVVKRSFNQKFSIKILYRVVALDLLVDDAPVLRHVIGLLKRQRLLVEAWNGSSRNIFHPVVRCSRGGIFREFIRHSSHLLSNLPSSLLLLLRGKEKGMKKSKEIEENVHECLWVIRRGGGEEVNDDYRDRNASTGNPEIRIDHLHNLSKDKAKLGLVELFFP